MNPLFMNAARAGAFATAMVMGQPVTFTLRDGRIFTLHAVFRPRSERVMIDDGGTEIVTKVPALSIQRSALISAGISDREMEKEILGATFEIDGRVYAVQDPEDDETMFLRAWPVLKPTAGYDGKYSRPAVDRA